jgi:asparagine synthase (glutamine-hydrolysing)
MMYQTSLNEMLHSSMTKSGLLSLLRYEDRNSMSFSIESRTPFADDTPLIEYVFQIPSSYKIVQGWSKALLRQSMIDIIPNENRLRKDKVAFATPEYSWLNESKDFLQSFISSELSEYFDVTSLLRDWDKLLQSQNKEGITMIWRFINVAIWMKVFAK